VRILTYNVAGLPWILTGERRRAVMPRIGELLNDFPLALVQEDFAWHEDLARFARHPYRSAPGSAGWALYADGLSTFSALPLREVARVAWNSCHGVFRANSDCLASKGFAVFEVALGQGVSVHVYNLHGDAGKRKGDRRSRTRGYGQLARHLQSASRERAVIVAGDTNLKDGDAEDRRTLARFLGATGLRDACRSLACGDERIDRVFFRGTSALALRPTEWRIERDFVDPAGRALSDHAAVSVRFAWTAHPARRPPEP
jgi:endonuclease/exonuclease/phosphatase family metal-dependent hydrolase